MLTYKRYQALRTINIRVPGEPRNEAKELCLKRQFLAERGSLGTRLVHNLVRVSHSRTNSGLECEQLFPGLNL